jgi:hypothetical protein
MTHATIRKTNEGRTVAVVGDVYRFLATRGFATLVSVQLFDCERSMARR